MRAEPRIEATRNIRTLPIAKLLGKAIKRTATESSVSSLFD
jgi:phosphoribosylpyrophosphate synthetase